MRLCARALRPLAHPAAHSRAQGTRVAGTAVTQKRPRAVAWLAQGQASRAWSAPRSLHHRGRDPYSLPFTLMLDA